MAVFADIEVRRVDLVTRAARKSSPRRAEIYFTGCRGCISRRGFRLSNVGCLKPFRALCNLEFDGIAFLEGFKSLLLDGSVVDENIRFVLLRDESKALCVVEPLHSSLRHLATPISAAPSGPIQ